MLAKIEASSNIKRENIVYGLSSAVAVYLVLGHGAELLCNFIGFAYPAYASCKYAVSGTLWEGSNGSFSFQSRLSNRWTRPTIRNG